MNKKTLLGTMSILLLVTISMTISVNAQSYTIEGDTVYISLANKGMVSQTPHTLKSINNDVELNFTSFFGTEQTFDFALGFNTDIVTVGKIRLLNPKVLDIEKSFTCNEPFWFNYTTSPNIFWCWRDVNEYIENQSTWNNNTYLIYSHEFDSYNTTTKTAYWTEQKYVEYQDITDKFETINYNYNGNDLWYTIKDVDFIPDETKSIHITLSIEPSIGEISGKYDILAKRSSDTIAEAISSGNYVHLDPWYNTSWSNCKNITFSETYGGLDRVGGNDPVFINVTGLTFSNAENEIRIVNAGCNEGGSEVPSHLLSNTSDSAELTFLANITDTQNWSVYYNFSGASEKFYDTGMSSDSGYVVKGDGSEYWHGDTGCVTGGSGRFLCNLTTKGNIDFDPTTYPMAGGATASFYFYDDAWEEFNLTLISNSSVFSMYADESNTGRWNLTMNQWANSGIIQFVFKFLAVNDNIADFRLPLTTSYNNSYNWWVMRNDTNVSVVPISGLTTWDIKDNFSYSGYVDLYTGESYLFFLGNATNETIDWKSCEGYGNQLPNNSVNYPLCLQSDSSIETNNSYTFYGLHLSGFSFGDDNINLYDNISARLHNNLNYIIGNEVTQELNDTTQPNLIDFVSPTPSNSTSTTNNSVYVNVTFNELNPDICLIEFGINNYSGVIDGEFCSYNVTGISVSVYTYKAWINDTSGNTNSSATRTITILSSTPISQPVVSGIVVVLLGLFTVFYAISLMHFVVGSLRTDSSPENIKRITKIIILGLVFIMILAFAVSMLI